VIEFGSCGALDAAEIGEALLPSRKRRASPSRLRSTRGQGLRSRADDHRRQRSGRGLLFRAGLSVKNRAGGEMIVAIFPKHCCIAFRSPEPDRSGNVLVDTATLALLVRLTDIVSGITEAWHMLPAPWFDKLTMRASS
jgi:hypothetical protein